MADVPRLDISRLHIQPDISKEAQLGLAQDLQKLVLSLVEFDHGKRPSIAEMHSALRALKERATVLESKPSVSDLPLASQEPMPGHANQPMSLPSGQQYPGTPGQAWPQAVYAGQAGGPPGYSPPQVAGQVPLVAHNPSPVLSPPGAYQRQFSMERP